MTRPTFTLPALLLGAALLPACSLAPVRIDDTGLKDITQADRAAVREGVAPLGPRLGMDEAIARALKYNLDRRARQLEEALALRQFQELGNDRLPKLMAAAGYTARDKDRVANSIDSVTGQPSLANPSISQDRSHVLSSLTLSWSLLDYGLVLAPV